MYTHCTQRTADDENGIFFFSRLLSIIKYGIMLNLPIKMYNSKWIFEFESANSFPIGPARALLSRFKYFYVWYSLRIIIIDIKFDKTDGVQAK